MFHVRRYFHNFRYRDWKTIALLAGIGLSFVLMAGILDYLSGVAQPNWPSLPWVLAAVPIGMAAFDVVTGYLSRITTESHDLKNPYVLWQLECLEWSMRHEYVHKTGPVALTSAEEVARMIVYGANDAHELHRIRRRLVEIILGGIDRQRFSGVELLTMFHGFDPAVYADVVEERYGRNTSDGPTHAATLLSLARAPSRLVTPEMLAVWNASKLVPVGLA